MIKYVEGFEYEKGPTRVDDDPLLPLGVPLGHAIVLWPKDLAEHTIKQLALIESHALIMEQQESLVAATFALGEIRGRLLALRDVGIISDEESDERGEAIKARYMEQWRGVFDAAMEDDK